jgi:LPXTG-motif cell wall-anchored protein
VRPPRRIAVLVCAAFLAVAPGAAWAQSGDDGFQDPLGSQTAPDPSLGEPLTDEPQVDPDPVDPEPVDPPPLDPIEDELDDVPQEDPQDSESELANTGIDARLFAAIGAALLLMGAGLRMRTLPERF